MAITVAKAATQVTAGTASFDFTGADYGWLAISAFDSGFANGLAVPTTLTYATVGWTQWFAASGGTAITNSFTVYVLKAPTSGANNLVITLPAGPYGGGPTMFCGGLVGVNQNATESNNIRAAVQDNTLSTSVSLVSASPAASDYGLLVLRDFTDTSATISANTTQDAVATVNSETVRPCHLTDPTLAGGATAMTNGSGVVINFIAAAVASVAGSGLLLSSRRNRLVLA